LVSSAFASWPTGAATVLAAGSPEEAARALREALRWWRGPALTDFAYDPFAQAAIVQLDELYLLRERSSRLAGLTTEFPRKPQARET
jgi:hypothetical protein